MKNYIKHIVEDFNFNQVHQETDYDELVFQQYYNKIFKKIFEHFPLTNEEYRALERNAKNNYPFKYKVKDLDELRDLVKVVYDDFDLNWVDVSGLTSLRHVFANSTNVEELTEAFCWGFERPSVKYANLNHRIEMAKEYSNLYR